jgi:hypothetical protein
VESVNEDGWTSAARSTDPDWFKFVLKRMNDKNSSKESKFVQKEISYFNDNYIRLGDYPWPSNKNTLWYCIHNMNLCYSPEPTNDDKSKVRIYIRNPLSTLDDYVNSDYWKTNIVMSMNHAEYNYNMDGTEIELESMRDVYEKYKRTHSPESYYQAIYNVYTNECVRVENCWNYESDVETQALNWSAPEDWPEPTIPKVYTPDAPKKKKKKKKIKTEVLPKKNLKKEFDNEAFNNEQTMKIIEEDDKTKSQRITQEQAEQMYNYDDSWDEYRQDLNGNWYNRRQFYDYYGSDEAWDNLNPDIYVPKRQCDFNQKWYTKEEFYQYYGTNDIWDYSHPSLRLRRKMICDIYMWANSLDPNIQHRFISDMLDTYE